MKYLMVAIVGAADQPTEELGGKTPFEVAKIPNLNHFAKSGKVGQVKLTSEHKDPSADANFLNFLGYDADKVYTGRGPIEAANLALKLEENEVAFRMNFITESDGKLADPTAGKLTSKEAMALINYLNKRIASDFVKFFAGSEYRHVAVLKDAHGYEALSARTSPPDAIVGEPMENFFPQGPGEELLKKLMYDAKLLLQDHEINQVRVDLGENPANMIWLWGQGKRPEIEVFEEKYGVRGSVVAAIEYAKGVARTTGMRVYEVAGGTGDTETDYENKVTTLLDALNENDLVCLHIRACDEAARRGDMKAKVSALEAMDFHVLSRIREYVDRDKDARLLISPVHASPWKLRKHVREAVPFVTCGRNVRPDDIEKFSELAANTSELKINSGVELMNSFLNKG